MNVCLLVRYVNHTFYTRAKFDRRSNIAEICHATYDYKIILILIFWILSMRFHNTMHV